MLRGRGRAASIARSIHGNRWPNKNSPAGRCCGGLLADHFLDRGHDGGKGGAGSTHFWP
jgi:hypothetical protein